MIGEFPADPLVNLPRTLHLALGIGGLADQVKPLCLELVFGIFFQSGQSNIDGIIVPAHGIKNIPLDKISLQA